MIGRSAIGRSVAAIAFTLCAALSSGQSPDHPITRSPDGVTRSPDSLLAGELDAKGFASRVAAEKGHVVLVNFWATWCVPCREEFPDLVRLQKAYGEKGLRVIGISTDFSKQLPAVETFLARQRPTFPNYHKKSGGDDQDFIEAVDSKWTGELPFSVLFDREGRKARTLAGRSSYADFEREVRKVLP